jgi:hypothetical protein
VIGGLIVGFCVGVLFTSWRYHVNAGPIVAQAERVAHVLTRTNEPIGPELQELGRRVYLRRPM